ncbi:MAG: hypothetical protein LBO07_06900 [Coriobacteriales bacterium]|jgi:ABC-type branched-subunit amino acid transport system ATPase component|nr:hypothetical protein [Coriobacteriales bacterium]
MNIRYENLSYAIRERDGEKPVFSLGHGQIDHASITALIGSDRAAQRAFLEIAAGLLQPTDGRLTYGTLGKDGRWRYSPEIPHERLALVRSKRNSFLPWLRRRQDYPALLRTALLRRPELLLLDEPSAPIREDEELEIDELLLETTRKNGTTVILISGDTERLARLKALTLAVT